MCVCVDMCVVCVHESAMARAGVRVCAYVCVCVCVLDNDGDSVARPNQLN